MNQHPTLRARRIGIFVAVVICCLFTLVALTANATPKQTALAQSPSADLRLSLAFLAPEPAPDGAFSYTYTIKNDGPDIARSVSLRARVPRSVTIDSIEAPRGVCALPDANTPRALRCDLGRLRVDASISVVVHARIHTSRPSLKFRATVTAQTADKNPGNNKASQTQRFESRFLQILSATAPAWGRVKHFWVLALSRPTARALQTLTLR